MTKLRLINILRRQAYYKPMLATLEAAGIPREQWEILPATGRGHAILEFRYLGEKHRIPLPGTPTGFSAATHYIPTAIKHAVAAARKRIGLPGKVSE